MKLDYQTRQEIFERKRHHIVVLDFQIKTTIRSIDKLTKLPIDEHGTFRNNQIEHLSRLLTRRRHIRKLMCRIVMRLCPLPFDLKEAKYTFRGVINSDSEEYRTCVRSGHALRYYFTPSEKTSEYIICDECQAYYKSST